MIYEVRVMVIIEVKSNKKIYMDLLFLADEQEDMINCYLERGTMYILDDNGVKAECVVTEEPNGILEIKNIAVRPNHQRKGYGKKLIDFLVEQYSGQYAFLQVGTRNSRTSTICLSFCFPTRSGRPSRPTAYGRRRKTTAR